MGTGEGPGPRGGQAGAALSGQTCATATVSLDATGAPGRWRSSHGKHNLAELGFLGSGSAPDLQVTVWASDPSSVTRLHWVR